ncbi:CUB domain-containing protein 2-like isoform X2 [Littorina saxatilis]|uniref:CUB domain-containing protein 2-like isoform X2 n=1 Tax=Littorina saxatilis TaxID=31220 RepID=UPI0038B61EB4
MLPIRPGQHGRWPIRDVLTAVLVIFLQLCVAHKRVCEEVREVNVNHWRLDVGSDNLYQYLEGSCTWNITVDEGYTILAGIHVQTMLWSPDCRREHFKFYDDDSLSDGTLLNTFCGGTSYVESSSNELLTEFYAEGTTGYTYTSVEYHAVNETNECGIVDLSGSEGSFQIRRSVRRNGKCVWNITAEEGFNILLRITEYSLHSIDDNCLCNASLFKVYDGNKEDESHLVRNFCGSTYNAAETDLVISTTNSLLVVLTLQENSGFSIVNLRANYTAVNATLVNRNCGGNVTGSEGNITSPNYPDNYDNLTTCQWFITIDPAYSVQLDIDYSFDNCYTSDDYATCNSDSLMVADGNGSVVRALCARNYYYGGYPLRTYGNRAIVAFTTDQEGTDSGFIMHWYRVCERTLDSSREGTLQSPNYPDNYPGNLSCVYNVGSVVGYSMVITFHNFKLEGPSSNGSCTNDYLEVDYRSSSDLPLGMEETKRYCGDNIPSTLTLYPPVEIRFVTDLYNSRSGYQASYEFFEADCGKLLFTGEAGTITSPNYPGTYPSLLNCTYVIRVEPGQTVNLTFDHMSLRSRWTDEMQGVDCITSFSLWSGLAVLSVFDGEVSANNVSAANDSLIDIFCGDRPPSPVSSNSSAMTLLFFPGYNFGLRGFSATYTTVGNTSS